MSKVTTLILKVLGFFAFCLAFWQWGKVSAGKKVAEDRANEAIKTSNEFEKINSEPFVSNPADWLCYDESEYPTLSEDAKEAGKNSE